MHTHADGDLLMLHGWGMHGGLLDDFAPLLAARLRVHRPDLPGHGHNRAALPAQRDALVAQLATDMPACAHLFGWSLGGTLALELALAAPERIGALVLCAATPCFVQRPDWPAGMAGEVFAQFVHALAEDADATLQRFAALVSAGAADARTQLRTLRAALARRPRAQAQALAVGLDWLREADLRIRAGALAQRVCIIHGEHDQLAPPAAARWLAERCPRAQLHVIAGAAHAPFLSHPAQVAAIVRDFLDA